jgi:TRAP-type C4-dicarboxylate transport system substrate-binding protein
MPAGPEWLVLGRAIGVSPVPLGMPEVYLAMKTGTIDGQENPLSILSAAKLYEVSEQVALTSHMLQPVFFAIASPIWAKLTQTQRFALEAIAKKQSVAGDEGRIADEASIVKTLKERGLTVESVDLAAFRASADTAYSGNDLTKSWDMALLKRVQEA